MRLAATAVVLLLAIISCLGCGGSSSSSASRTVEGVVRRWQSAVARRDLKEACARLDERGQAMLRRELAGFVAAHATGSSCDELIGFLHDGVMTQSQRAEFAASMPVAVTITGDNAKARTGGADYSLSHTGGRWQISEIPLSTST